MSKIFIIGVSKTGTTSLAGALEILEYKTSGLNKDLIEEVHQGDYAGVYQTLENADVFHDWPYPKLYKEMYENVPDSKFILTVRKNESVWYRSLTLHMSLLENSKLNLKTLGFGDFNEVSREDVISRYNIHNAEVREFFKDKGDRFFEFCIDKSPDWHGVCEFLGEDVPKEPFPKKNVKSHDLLQVIRNRRDKYVGKVLNHDRESIARGDSPRLKRRLKKLRAMIHIYNKKIRNYKKVSSQLNKSKRK